MNKMSKTIKRNFPVVGMGCAACVARVEGAIKATKGVKECSVSLASNSAQVEYDASVVKAAGIKKSVQDAGYDLLVQDDDDSDEDHLRQEAEALRHTLGEGAFPGPAGSVDGNTDFIHIVLLHRH